MAGAAARHGARVALAGGAGEDGWGRWLRDRLAREGVDISLFALLPGSATPVVIVAVDATGEPIHQIYGEAAAMGRTPRRSARRCRHGRRRRIHHLRHPYQHDERAVTMRAREAALASDRPVVFDANMRPERWRSRAEAAAACNACVPGALLVRAGARSAAAMTGEDDPERAALALLKAGARMVVITLGAEGAMLRGEFRADAPARPDAVRSTIGAGDVLTGVLVARLATSGYYPAAVAAPLPEAVEQSALACERWGALE